MNTAKGPMARCLRQVCGAVRLTVFGHPVSANPLRPAEGPRGHTSPGAKWRSRGRHALATVHNRDPDHIDWAKVAARARADLGDEPVAHFSDRLRMTMMVTAGALRPGDTEGLRFGEPPPGA